MYVARKIERIIEKIDKVKWLKRLGARLINSSGNQWGSLSPFRDESTPSFFMDKKTGLWIDHGDGDKRFRGNFIQFVAMRWKQLPRRFDEKLVISEEEAWKIIEADEDIPEETTPLSEIKMRLKDLQENKQKEDKEFQPLGLPSDFDWAWNYPAAMEYLMGPKRKLTEETIKLNNLGFCPSGYFKDRVVIPVESSDIVWGFAARLISEPPSKEIKKILYPSGFKSSMFLSGIDNHINKKIIVINEGWFDSAYGDQILRQNGLDSSVGNVCSWGTNFSLHQRQLLYSANLEEVVIAYDDDTKSQTGQKAAEELIKSLTALKLTGIRISRFRLPPGKDPNDCSAEEWLGAFEKRIEQKASPDETAAKLRRMTMRIKGN